MYYDNYGNGDCDYMIDKWPEFVKSSQEDYCYRKHSQDWRDSQNEGDLWLATGYQSEEDYRHFTSLGREDYQHDIDADYTTLIIETFDYSEINIVYK